MTAADPHGRLFEMLWHLQMEPELILTPYFPDLTDPSERVSFQPPKKVPNPEREERLRAHLERDRIEYEEQARASSLANREWVDRRKAEENRREIVRLCEREIREHRIATRIEVSVEKVLSKSEQWDQVETATTPPSSQYRPLWGYLRKGAVDLSEDVIERIDAREAQQRMELEFTRRLWAKGPETPEVLWA